MLDQHWVQRVFKAPFHFTLLCCSLTSADHKDSHHANIMHCINTRQDKVNVGVT